MEKGWMNNKTFLRIFSVLAAFVLWFFVITNEDPPRNGKIEDVEIICGLNQTQLNEGMVIFSKSSSTLEFTAHGKRSLVTGVRGAYYAKLNLDSVTEPGKYSITPEISSPEGVTIKDINPSAIEVYVDKYVTSLMPVKVVTKNSLSDGLVASNIEPAQKQLTITLPSLALEEIAYAGLELDLKNISQSDKINCKVSFYDSFDNRIDNSGIITDVEEISVSVELERHKTVSIIPDVRINGQLPDDCEIKTTPHEIEIYGESDAVNSAQTLSTQPVVFDSVPEIGQEYKTKIILPEGVYLKDGVENTVTISLKNKNE